MRMHFEAWSRPLTHRSWKTAWAVTVVRRARRERGSIVILMARWDGFGKRGMWWCGVVCKCTRRINLFREGLRVRDINVLFVLVEKFDHGLAIT